MAKNQRFEDLLAWQRARRLCARVFEASARPPLSRSYALANQIQRAAISVHSYIAGGFERSRPGEFHHFLSIAKGSCGEVRSQLYTARDVGLLTEEAFSVLIRDAEEVSRLIGALRIAVALRLKPK